MSDRDDFGAFLIGFTVGGLAGAVVALLFAPQSGTETRTLIKEKAIELKDVAGVKIEEQREKVSQVVAPKKKGKPEAPEAAEG